MVRNRDGYWAAALGLAILLLPAGAAHAAGRIDGEIDYAPKGCEGGRLAEYPKVGRDGIVAHYRFDIYDWKVNSASILKRIEDEQLYQAFYDEGGTGKTDFYIERFHSVAEAPAQLDEDLVRLCRILTPFGLELRQVWFRTQKADAELARRKAEAARKFHRENPRVLDQPQANEIEEVLRANWKDRFENELFSRHDTQFARVREGDILCTYVESSLGAEEDHVSCEVGVLGTSPRGPEYAKGKIDFTRGRSHNAGRPRQLLLYEEPLGDIVVN